jgi:hypothetical protein
MPIIPPPIIPCTRIRGQLGRTWIFSANRYGPIVRDDPYSTQYWPPDAFGTKAILLALNSLWQSLTDPQRNQWHRRARHRRTTRRLEFLRLNLTRFHLGLNPIPEP